MAELPIFRRSVGIPGGSGMRQIGPGQTGAGAVADILGAAAQGAGNVAAALDEIQKTKESAWITRATGEAAIWSDETARKLESESTEGAPEHVKTYRQTWGEYRDNLLKAAPSQRARDALSEQLTGIEVSEVRRRGAFQAKSELNKRGADWEKGINGLIFAARQNPNDLGASLARVEGHIAAASAWLPATSIPETAANVRGAMVSAAAEGMIENKDYVAARFYVEGDEFGQFLSPDQRAALVQKIEKGERGEFIQGTASAIAGEMGTASGGVSFDDLVGNVIYQESRGRADAVSPKGARGVMQLMPDTAKEVAAELGIEYDEKRLLTDPAYNETLGRHYLQKQVDKYGNQALALAAYNAGPGRVDEWIERFGDPRTGEISMADFVAKIPFEETRDYVQKIDARSGGGIISSPAEILLARANEIDDPDLRDSVISEARAEFSLIDAANSRRQAQREAQFDAARAQLEVNVSRNIATYEDINDARDSGVLNSAQWADFTRAKDAAVESQNKKTKALRQATTKLMAGGAFNVFEKEDRDGIDAIYEQTDQSPEAAMALISASGIAPEAVVNDMKLKLRTGDADAFEFADNALRAAPNAFNRNDGEGLVKRVDEFRGYTRNGFTKEQAAQKASRSDEERKNLVGETTAVTKELTDTKTKDIVGLLGAGGFFRGATINPGREQRLRNDYEIGYREARSDGNSPDDAAAIAAERIKRIWGPSSVNGDEEVMRFPPEQYYPGGKDGIGYFTDQINAHIEEQSGAPPESIRVISDAATESDIRAGLLPRYKVFYVDKSGFPQEIFGWFRADPKQATEELSATRKSLLEQQQADIEGFRQRSQQAKTEPLFPRPDARLPQ